MRLLTCFCVLFFKAIILTKNEWTDKRRTFLIVSAATVAAKSDGKPYYVVGREFLENPANVNLCGNSVND